MDLVLIHQFPPRSKLGSPNNRIVPDVGLALACTEIEVTLQLIPMFQIIVVGILQNDLI